MPFRSFFKVIKPHNHIIYFLARSFRLILPTVTTIRLLLLSRCFRKLEAREGFQNGMHNTRKRRSLNCHLAKSADLSIKSTVFLSFSNSLYFTLTCTDHRVQDGLLPSSQDVTLPTCSQVHDWHSCSSQYRCKRFCALCERIRVCF